MITFNKSLKRTHTKTKKFGKKASCVCEMSFPWWGQLDEVQGHKVVNAISKCMTLGVCIPSTNTVSLTGKKT